MSKRIRNNQDKSSNPNNRDCSSCRQALLDLKIAGFPNDLIDQLIDFANVNQEALENADKAFQEHQYPQHSIKFVKMSNEIEFCKYIGAPATAILTAMCQNMRTGNKIQLSQSDLLNITGVGNKKTVSKALGELMENGYIALVIDGNTRRSPVYMVNPKIATVGKSNPHLQYQFWKLSGTEFSYDDEKTVKSMPQQRWEINTAKRTYALGYDKQNTDDGLIIFNKINPPEIETAPSAVTLGTVDGSLDEDLPFSDNE